MSEHTERVHGIVAHMRKEMKISGVTEVECFDDTGAVFHTVCGDMTVEGKDIRIGVLDIAGGHVTLSGRIDGIFYAREEGEKKGRFLRKGSR